MTTSAYDAIRAGAALLPRPDRGLLLVAGADRIAWLQGLLTNDIAALRPGSGCYAACLTPQGRMISDLRVLHAGPAVLLDVPAATRDTLLARFDQFIITEDVRVEDWSSRLGRFGLHGPAAAPTLADVLEAAWWGPGDAGVVLERLVNLAEHASVLLPEARVEEGGGVLDVPARHVFVVGTREGGVRGFDLLVDAQSGALLRDALVARGATPVDAATWDVVRIEAATPVFGVDMDQDTIPLEAGIEDRAISFTKGCYVGQEVIVRVRDRGHGRVARRLVGLAAPVGDRLPLVGAGDPLRAGDREVGRVTSAAFSPTLGRTIALGYVHRDLTSPGTAIDAVHGTSAVPLVVVPTPFVARGAAERSP